KGASERIDRGNLAEADLVELHKYAGLSALYLQQKPEAERHLWALLQLDPDYSLDPFVVPPPAIAFFETIRKQHAAQLEPIREERRRRAERLREAEERERARAEAELQRRQLEELARQASLPRGRQQSFVLNFVPFGAGQFQQGRTTMGIIFAASEAVFALTSIGAYLAYNSLIRTDMITVDERLTPDTTYTFTLRGIRPENQHEATVWQNVKYASGGAFWVTYAVGVIDALIHHKPEIVVPQESSRSGPGQTLGLTATSPPPDVQPRIAVEPLVGGVGARVGITF
ncbi:MAG TPA: hypothetical protein VKE49_07860, partial [Myxococcaceae bacterium]|nr:hypothetical protein [Myxococcaceae bacterium]